MIHPTAIIDPRAEIGANVTIGPYAVIEGAARIGNRCIIRSHAIIGGHVVMDSDNVVDPHAVIGGDPQDFAFRTEIQSQVIIGRGNRIREGVTIHRGTAEGSATIVGNECFLMGGVHLGHNVRLGNGVIIANNSLLGGYVHVEDKVFISGACVFHQFTRVGKLAICQGTSGFSKNIPPCVIAAGRNGTVGLNVVGMRRSGMTPAERAEIKKAFDLLYRSGKNVSQACAIAREMAWSSEGRAFWDFIAESGKRGLVGFQSSRGKRPAGPGPDEI
jgi:UDP-N-acetylglucosamine acyltransferase